MVLNKKNIKRITRLTIMTGAAILLTVATVAIYNFYRLSPDFLYNQQYVSLELELDLTDTSTSPIEKAFAERKFTTVLRLKKKSVRLSPDDYFFCGMTYLKLNDPFNAIHSLQLAIAKDKMADATVYKNTAEFYLALAYLKNRDYDQALELMRAIHNNPAHPYHEKFSDRFIRKVKILKWR